MRVNYELYIFLYYLKSNFKVEHNFFLETFFFLNNRGVKLIEN